YLLLPGWCSDCLRVVVVPRGAHRPAATLVSYRTGDGGRGLSPGSHRHQENNQDQKKPHAPQGVFPHGPLPSKRYDSCGPGLELRRARETGHDKYSTLVLEKHARPTETTRPTHSFV